MTKNTDNDTVLVRWNFVFCTWEFLCDEFNGGSLHLDKARRFTFDIAADLLATINTPERPWSTCSLEQARVLWAQS